jgi:hypothetical protein
MPTSTILAATRMCLQETVNDDLFKAEVTAARMQSYATTMAVASPRPRRTVTKIDGIATHAASITRWSGIPVPCLRRRPRCGDPRWTRKVRKWGSARDLLVISHAGHRAV